MNKEVSGEGAEKVVMGNMEHWIYHDFLCLDALKGTRNVEN